MSAGERRQEERIGDDWYFEFDPELIGIDTQWVFDNITISDLIELPKGKAIAMLALKEVLRCPYGDKTNAYARYIRLSIKNHHAQIQEDNQA